MEWLRRVGRDVDAAAYWTDRASAYADALEGRYQRHRRAVIEALFPGEPPSTVVDFGCGEGLFLERFPAATSRVGIDPSPELVERARRRFEGAIGVELGVGGVDALSDAQSDSVDLLLALNVLAYLTDDEERLFYEQASRVLRRGGNLIVTHSNELFDLYSLNAYTAEFFRRHLLDAESEGVAQLLRFPDRPERITFNVRENPLAYGHKLRQFGFEERQQEFINFHPEPPLLMDPEVFEDIDGRAYDDTLTWPPETRWKLIFQCSMFGSRGERLG